MSLLCACGGRDGRQRDDAGADAAVPTCDEPREEEGCPCDALEPVLCWEGPETADWGVCLRGLRTCAGRWGPCEGQVLPVAEVCNDRDDDCNGEIDDGVQNACGTCDPVCEETAFGHEAGEIPFDSQDSSCTGLVGPGDLVIDDPRPLRHVVWIPNTVQGTVSLVNSRTREELRRHWTAPDAALASPSRTSVDYRSDVYVANRAFGEQASVTKVWTDPCPDVDGDGVVETSTGRDDVPDWGEDECVAWRTEVGDVGAVANALAAQGRVELDGVFGEYVWAGLQEDQEVVELDGETGEPTGTVVDVSPCRPTGAAIDRDGNLWSACVGQDLVRFDTEDPADSETVARAAEVKGIALDSNGRVWVGGSVGVYDPEDGSWTDVPDTSGYGVAPTGDDEVWIGECAALAGTGTCRVDGDSLEVTLVEAASRAVAYDSDGFAWAISQSGTVDVIDPDSLEVETILDDCGGPCLDGPEAYSDMAGIWISHSECRSNWQTIVEGCPGGRWVTVSWDVDAPEGAGISIQVKAANSPDDAWWPMVPVALVPADASPALLEPLLGVDAVRPLLRVYVELWAFGRETPIVHRLAVQRSCP